MGKCADLSTAQTAKIEVLLLHSRGTQTEIAKIVGVSQASVNRVKKSLVLEGEGEFCKGRRGRICRPRVTTPRQDRIMCELVRRDPRLSCKKVATQIMKQGSLVSRRTVSRRLLESGFRSYRPRRKPRLTAGMIEKRLQWAKKYSKWTVEQWKKVISYKHPVKL